MNDFRYGQAVAKDAGPASWVDRLLPRVSALPSQRNTSIMRSCMLWTRTVWPSRAKAAASAQAPIGHFGDLAQRVTVNGVKTEQAVVVMERVGWRLGAAVLGANRQIAAVGGELQRFRPAGHAEGADGAVWL